MSDYLDPNNEELLKDFFAEAEQQVDTLESNVLVVENDPSNHEAIDEIFRAAHTLKGGSATVEMTELSGFTHKVEDVLDEIRSDRIQVNEDVVDILLALPTIDRSLCLDSKIHGLTTNRERDITIPLNLDDWFRINRPRIVECTRCSQNQRFYSFLITEGLHV